MHYNHDVSDSNSFYVERLLADSEQANVWQTAALLGPWVGRVYADNPFLPAAISQQLLSEGRTFANFGIFTPNLPGMGPRRLRPAGLLIETHRVFLRARLLA